MRIGILTGGGDCPGLNAVIRSAVVHGIGGYNCSFVGFRDGWRGVLSRDIVELDHRYVHGISRLGGTVLGTSRTGLSGDAQEAASAHHSLSAAGVDWLIVVGGDGTLSAARQLAESGVNIIGVPKTIDNDILATDYSFGFDTAVQIATDAIDRLATTGDSHHRCMVAEVMGRNAGWIALHTGIASNAHCILIPEHPASADDICDLVNRAFRRKRTAVVVVAEAFTLEDSDGIPSVRGVEESGRPILGGIGELVGHLVSERTGIETRVTRLGHIQRGGGPTAFDRVLASRLGIAAVDAAMRGDDGCMVALQGTSIVTVPLASALSEAKTVTASRYSEASALFG